MFSNIHYSTGISSLHSGVCISAKVSLCVNICKGSTLPSAIKVGVFVYLITNSSPSKLILTVFSLDSSTCEKSMFNKSPIDYIAYVFIVFFMLVH